MGTSTNAKRDVHHEMIADFYLATPMERVSCTLIVIKRAVHITAAGRDNARTNKKRRIRLFLKQNCLMFIPLRLFFLSPELLKNTFYFFLNYRSILLFTFF